MPIKPENRGRYPANWKTEIRPAILKRANNRCEFCGVPNYRLGYRDGQGKFKAVDERQFSEGQIIQYILAETDDQKWYLDKDPMLCAVQHGEAKVFKIVLTIAHLDHTPENNDPDNLRALCQKCHLNHDKDHHRRSRINKTDKKPFIDTGCLTESIRRAWGNNA